MEGLLSTGPTPSSFNIFHVKKYGRQFPTLGPMAPLSEKSFMVREFFGEEKNVFLVKQVFFVKCFFDVTKFFGGKVLDKKKMA